MSTRPSGRVRDDPVDRLTPRAHLTRLLVSWVRVIVRGMSENTASGTYRGAFLEEAKAAGRARIAEARSDAEAVAWAERNADVLERRLRDRGVS